MKFHTAILGLLTTTAGSVAGQYDPALTDGTIAITNDVADPISLFEPIEYVGKATATLSDNVHWTSGEHPNWLVNGGTRLGSYGLSAVYDSIACDVAIDDLGYATVDLQESLDLGAVQIFMEPGEYCNMYVSVWDGTVDQGPSKPAISCPGRLGKRPHLTGSMCFTCGDLSRNIPCTGFDLRAQQPIQCPDEQPYCMNDIYQEAGQQPKVYKHCVNEATCHQQWYLESSNKVHCFEYDPALFHGDLVCHLCCYGDECNRDNVPLEATRYKPGRRALADTTDVCDTNYNVEFPADGSGVTVPMPVNTKARFIRVWSGRKSATSRVGFIQIKPLGLRYTMAPSMVPSIVPTDAPSLAPSMSKATIKAKKAYLADGSFAVSEKTINSINPFLVMDYVGNATATLSTNVNWDGWDASHLVDGSSAGTVQTTGVSYDSATCDVAIDDLGYVTIDLGKALDLDGVRIFMEPGEYCNMYVSVWDGTVDQGPTEPANNCRGRQPSLGLPATPAPTLAPLKGSKCYTCGDFDSKRPCTRRMIIPRPNHLHTCPEETPYCMNDIYQVAGQQASIFKRCVNEATCRQEWYLESSDKVYCFEYDPGLYRDDLVCHLCCYGDECNKDLLPPEDTRYKPGRRALAATTEFCDTDYNVKSPADGSGITLPFPFDVNKVRFIRVWSGRNSATSKVGFLEVQPLKSQNVEDVLPPDPVGVGNVTFSTDDFIPADPAPPAPPAAPGVTGDPHFTTYGGEKYDFHGGCSLVFLHIPDFAHGKELRIHIRTNITSWWSSIESAAIQIGNETFELQGKKHGGGTYWLNGKEHDLEELQSKDEVHLSGYTLKYSKRTSTVHQFRLGVGRGGIGFETYKDFINLKVNVQANKAALFKGSVGLLGSFPDGIKLGRDGVTDFKDDHDGFGKEWQVLPNEPFLFSEVKGVQAPQECAMPVKSESRKLRGAGRSDDMLTQEEAEDACSGIPDEDIPACIFDVLATNDVGMAGVY